MIERFMCLFFGHKSWAPHNLTPFVIHIELATAKIDTLLCRRCWTLYTVEVSKTTQEVE